MMEKILFQLLVQKKIIRIFKKKIAKKLGPSPISWLDNLKPQLHFFFISKKLLKIE